jgi:hypothetical protein
VQCGFQAKYHTEPPTDKTIREWYRKFEETDCLCAAKRTGRPGSLPETVDRIRESFTRSPQKSTRGASRELQQDGAPPHFHLEVRRPTIPLYLSVGLGVRLTKTLHLFPGLPGHPTSLHLTFSSGAMLKIKFTCPLYQEICQSFNRESWLQLIASMLICCNMCGKS